MGKIIDAAGRWVSGFIDAHSHIGLFEEAVGEVGEDGNEWTDPQPSPSIRCRKSC